MNSGVIVCGFGHVGYRIAILLRRLGEGVTAIYDEAQADWIHAAEALGVVCIRGDASDDSVLEKAGVKTARAVIAATDNDMTNISISMDARRLNKGIIAVTRLFDMDLGTHIETALGVRKALSTSSLSAPVFVASALGEEMLDCFVHNGKSYAIAEWAATPASGGKSVAELGRLHGFVPLFSIKAGALIPVRETLTAGDRVLVLKDVRTVGLPRGTGCIRASGFSGIFRPALNLWRQIPSALKWVLATLVAIVAAGVGIFHFMMGLNLIDALYFVVTIITTTGFGDYNLSGVGPSLKMFGCFLMLCGAALMATVFSVITDALLRVRFRKLISRPVDPMIPHVIVVGLTHVGNRVIEELRRACLTVVAIPVDAQGKPDDAGDKDISIIAGDPRTSGTLMKAGIASAAAIVSVTEDDVMNLGIGLHAKKLNPGVRTVVRTFDAMLGSKLQDQLGINRVLSVSAVSAPTFAGSVLCRNLIRGSLWQNNLLLISSDICGLEISRPGQLSVTLRLSSNLLGLERAADQTPSDGSPAPCLSVSSIPFCHQAFLPS